MAHAWLTAESSQQAHSIAECNSYQGEEELERLLQRPTVSDAAEAARGLFLALHCGRPLAVSASPPVACATLSVAMSSSNNSKLIASPYLQPHSIGRMRSTTDPEAG